MTKNVISLGVNSSVMDAAEILHEKNIRQFPVIDSSGHLVGIVSDRDIRDAMPSKFIPGDAVTHKGGGLYTLTASDIMTMDPITVSSNSAINEVAELLVKYKIGGVPVVDDGELTGIITQADVLRFLTAATGSKHTGTQLAFRLDARPGPLAGLLCDLRDLGITFSSVFTANDGGHRNTYIQVEDLGDSSMETIIERLQDKYDLIFYVNEGITVDMR
ncbi:CBS and ACT domain-containing protein [Pseudodesulfovibrio sp. zrk46]|uniref:CBS and ACT domain-containing protein n=1 Tax=Pseudodesulfovibrio sp. zrk46 TaxID=2725288 RepID=UPI001FFD4699|nr:CBS and ACT domain-containing protein [Pseudodesulfovibrio sp. zrk46]